MEGLLSTRSSSFIDPSLLDVVTPTNTNFISFLAKSVTFRNYPSDHDDGKCVVRISC